MISQLRIIEKINLKVKLIDEFFRIFWQQRIIWSKWGLLTDISENAQILWPGGYLWIPAHKRIK